jgi:hypothetical protein
MADTDTKTRSHEDLYAELMRSFSGQGLDYRVASDSWSYRQRPISQGELAKLVAFKLDSTPSRAGVVLTQASYDAFDRALERVRGWLRQSDARPRSDAGLRRWLSALVRPGTPELALEAHVAAMRQWLWQIKRGIAERDVEWHVAPIFWSVEGGTGKSFNLRRLIAPLDNFTRHVAVDELGERFSGRLFARTLVAFLDEFAGADGVNAAALKAILTGKPIDARDIYSDSGFYAQNRLSAVGTSNLAPPHGFVDTTGARRFWSIHCNGEKAREGSERRKILDGMDIEDIWACVDSDMTSVEDTIPREVIAYMDKVRQEQLRSRTSLEDFCNECLETAPGEKIPLKEFQEIYKGYCEQSRQRIIKGGYRVYSELLRELGYRTVRHAQYWYLKDKRVVDFTRSHD